MKPNSKCILFHWDIKRFVISFLQAKSYSGRTGTTIRLPKSTVTFRIGSGCFQWIGEFSVPLPTPDFLLSHLNIDIILPDISLLIGLDILDKHHLVTENFENRLTRKNYACKMHITRKEGHLFLTWNFATLLFTKAELFKFHLRVFHDFVNVQQNHSI